MSIATTNSGSGSAAASTTTDKGEASLALLEDGAAMPMGASGTPVDHQLQQQQLQHGEQQPVGGAAWWWSKACCVHPLLILVQFIFSGACLEQQDELDLNLHHPTQPNPLMIH